MTPTADADRAALAPDVPLDYYERIREVERTHWWHVGMRELSAALLGERLRRPGQRVLDAGCGTGGLLRWVIDVAAPARAAGTDIGAAAIALAAEQVPEAELAVAPLHRLPYGDGEYDLVLCGDVLQHVPENEVALALRELHRVTAPGGTLLLRTNGARRARRERADWRVYDRRTLRAELEAVGWRCRRLTHANLVGSLLAATRGRAPRAPTGASHGIPTPAGPRADAVGRRLLSAEARWLAAGRSLPYGHTLLALAERP